MNERSNILQHQRGKVLQHSVKHCFLVKQRVQMLFLFNGEDQSHFSLFITRAALALNEPNQGRSATQPDDQIASFYIQSLYKK